MVVFAFLPHIVERLFDIQMLLCQSMSTVWGVNTLIGGVETWTLTSRIKSEANGNVKTFSLPNIRHQLGLYGCLLSQYDISLICCGKRERSFIWFHFGNHFLCWIKLRTKYADCPAQINSTLFLKFEFDSIHKYDLQPQKNPIFTDFQVNINPGWDWKPWPSFWKSKTPLEETAQVGTF